MEFLWFLGIVAEIVLLTYLDRKLWRTGFTPFQFVAIPYLLVLFLTVVCAGRTFLVDFYYPSIFPWMVGLVFFSLGSFASFYLSRFLSSRSILQKRNTLSFSLASAEPDRKLLCIVTLEVLVLESLCFFSVLRKGVYAVGSDDFGHAFAGQGWTGHLLVFNMVLALIWTSVIGSPFHGGKFSGKILVQWGFYLLSLFFLFLFQVKSWTMLPLLAGIIMRVLTGKTMMTLKKFFYIILLLTFFFFASYIILYFSGNAFSPEITSFKGQLVCTLQLFLHYLTSGTMGLSMDMEAGILEQTDVSYLLAPFVNFFRWITGNPDMVDAHNPFFLNTGLFYSNIRTAIGSYYVFSPLYLFLLICCLGGFFSNTLMFLGKNYGYWWIKVIYAWVSTILLMSWFDMFTHLLNVYEIPLFLMIYIGIDYWYRKRLVVVSK